MTESNTITVSDHNYTNGYVILTGRKSYNLSKGRIFWNGRISLLSTGIGFPIGLQDPSISENSFSFLVEFSYTQDDSHWGFSFALGDSHWGFSFALGDKDKLYSIVYTVIIFPIF